MKTLILDLNNQKSKIFTTVNNSFNKKSNSCKSISKAKVKFTLFPKDTKQNLRGGSCLARGLSLVLLPFLSAIDWYYGTSTMPILAGGLCYLEVTALTAYCPIKEIIEKYKTRQVDLLK